MDLYTSTSRELSRILTNRYSSSFSLSSRLFESAIQPHIYAIYGLVRIADEIVDTYDCNDQTELLNALETETYQAIKRSYSPNPIVHAFSLTAKQYQIEKDLIQPFFDSMRTDVQPPASFSDTAYRQYIHGSAEVIGIMCLKVFVNDKATYEHLAPGAKRLGAAYQKVNFLRDFADDYKRLNRVYFPGVTFASFDDTAKAQIESDIENDFREASIAIKQLPASAKKAVATSYALYRTLLNKLKETPAAQIKTSRVRIPTAQKSLIIAKHLAGAAK